MGVTVAELLQMPHLRLRLHSGKAGVDREVSWVHTSDLPDPWQWLTGGELLLTNGMSFPRRAHDQADLIERLVEVGANGLAIGERMYCPPLTRALSRVSDRLRLPVLWVSYPMPFVAISRAVAEATLLEQSQRLMRTERIYHALQTVTGSQHPDRSLLTSALGRELGCQVHICDRENADPWYPNDGPLGPDVARAVLDGTAGVVRAGAFVLPLSDGGQARLVEIPTHPEALMVAVSDGHGILDAVLMQHAATVLALEMSQALMSLEHARRAGAELLAQILDGHLDPRRSRRHLASAGIDPSRAAVIGATTPDEDRIRHLHIALWRHRIAHLSVHRSGLVYLLVHDEGDAIDTVRRCLGPRARLGVSASLTTASRVSDAAREALWALRVAGRDGITIARYGQIPAPWLGVSGIEQAQALVDRTLRPLLDYQGRHGGQLLDTLDAFFSQQRSWQRTAEALHVHRQTVLYRIHQIEAITRRDMKDTADIAELWLGLRALRLLAAPTGAEFDGSQPSTTAQDSPVGPTTA